MSRRGFTLVELMVALTVAALALSGAAAVFGSSTDTLELLEIRGDRWQESANARTWLAEALINVRMDPGTRPSFAGTADRFRFGTSLWTPNGWLEPSDVTVSFERGAVTMAAPPGPTLRLADSLGAAAIEYLAEFGSRSRWVARYESSLRPPVAVRLRLRHPGARVRLLLFYIGDRG